MKIVNLRIPPFKEAGCCRRERTIRRWIIRGNILNIVLALSFLLAYLITKKEPPSWFLPFVLWPFSILLIISSFCAHWLGSICHWIPETLSKEDAEAERSVFEKSQKDSSN